MWSGTFDSTVGETSQTERTVHQIICSKQMCFFWNSASDLFKIFFSGFHAQTISQGKRYVESRNTAQTSQDTRGDIA